MVEQKYYLDKTRLEIPPFSHEELLSMSKSPRAIDGDSITVPSWFGGRSGPLGSTYNQVWTILLLIPRNDGTLIHRLVVLPDFRESKSTTFDVSGTLGAGTGG